MMNTARTIRRLAVPPNLVWTLMGIHATGVVLAVATGRFTRFDGGVLLLVPFVALVVALRPAWVVLAFVAIPPGFLTYFSPRVFSFLMFGALIALPIIRGKLFADLKSGLLPLVLLLVAMFLFPSEVDVRAAQAADSFRWLLIYYLSLALLAYNATRYGDLKVRNLVYSLYVGAGLTGLIVLVSNGFNPSAIMARGGEAKYILDFKTHLGYVASMGFAVAYARALDPARQLDRWKMVDRVVAVVLLALTFMVVTRGAWSIALIALIYVPIKNRQNSYLLLVPAALLLILTVPVFRERLFADVSRGLGESLSTGEFASGRWGLWTFYWNDVFSKLPWGHGYGYVWTFSSFDVYGFAGEFNGDSFIYPHSSFMLWLIQFGLFGLGLFIAFWAHLRNAFKSITRRITTSFFDDPAWYLGGVLLAMFVAEALDNGIFMRGVSERFFATVGLVFGLAARGKRPPEGVGQSSEYALASSSS